MKNKKSKKSFHPVMFFIYLSIVVILLSGILDALNVQVTYDKLTTIAGEVESTTIAVNSFLSLDGLKFLLTSAYSNLTEFAPLGSLIIVSISFGIALKSGFLKSLCLKTNKIPRYIVIFLYSLICILCSVDSDFGYVLLLPLGAILFISMNRNPLGGLALGFCSIASGHGAGLFITSLDYNLTSYTEASAKLLDPDYSVLQNSNLFFIIAAAILISAVMAFVTEKLLLKKIGKNNFEEEEIVLEENKEKHGLIAALIITLITVIPIILMIIPSEGDEFIGLLLDKSQTEYTKMLFSSDALFLPSLVTLASVIMFLQGFAFGITTGTIKKFRDMIYFSADYLKEIGNIFVLIFFAAQLNAIFTETNLGIIITAYLSNVLAQTNFSFIPLILILFVFSLFSNLFLTGSVAKWSIFAPNVMLVMMKANVAPEFAQLVFRAGDSVTNCITPFFAYFVIFLGFVGVYTKNKSDFSIRNCYKLILPYFGVIAVIWLFMIICWYVIGLPVGPNIYPTI